MKAVANQSTNLWKLVKSKGRDAVAYWRIAPGGRVSESTERPGRETILFMNGQAQITTEGQTRIYEEGEYCTFSRRGEEHEIMNIGQNPLEMRVTYRTKGPI